MRHSIPAAAATEGDYTYTASGGYATITGYSGSGGDITVPSTLGGNTVTKISASVFYKNGSITGIVIPDTVTLIYNQSFD